MELLELETMVNETAQQFADNESTEDFFKARVKILRDSYEYIDMSNKMNVDYLKKYLKETEDLGKLLKIKSRVLEKISKAINGKKMNESTSFEFKDLLEKLG